MQIFSLVINIFLLSLTDNLVKIMVKKIYFCFLYFRSRLSLDLSSPTSELPVAQTTPTITTPTTAGPVNGTTNLISPRYTEFKTYSSTFDGLQALDNNNSNNHHNSNSNIAANSNNIVCNGLPLMRVASLPAITPPPPITGNYNRFIFLFSSFAFFILQIIPFNLMTFLTTFLSLKLYFTI